MPTSLASPTGRARIAYAMALLVFAGVTAWLVFGHHLHELEGLGIPTMEPRFVDARVFTGAATTMAQGLDPLVSNPGDPLGRPMNYPRAWLVLCNLGLGPDDATKLALAFFGSLIVGLAMLLPLVRTPAIAAVLALAIFSPSTWLAIERGNSDLLMFGVLAAAAWFATHRPALAGACVSIAAVLKLFPIFALAGLCTAGRQRALRSALAVAALFLGYVWWIRADLKLIHDHTAHWNRIAYGIDQLPELLAESTGWSLVWLLAIGAAALLLALLVSVLVRAHRRVGAATTLSGLAAFRIGAAVYFGTFCSGSNFDYRLMCLLLTVPQLVTWAATTRGVARASAIALLAVLLTMLWSMTWQDWLVGTLGNERPGLLIDEGLSWTLAFGMLAGLVLTVPDWLVPAAWRGKPFLDEPEREAAALLALPTAAMPNARRAAGGDLASRSAQ